MTNQYQEKQNNHKNPIDTVVSNVAGAAVIAGVAVAATIALQDKNNRNQLKKTLIKVKDQAIDYVQDFKKEQEIEESKIKPAIKSILKSKSKKLIAKIK